MYKNFYALVPMMGSEPQFPTVPACSYYEQTIDLRLCEQDEKILFGISIFKEEWPIWVQAYAQKKIEVFSNWHRVLAEYQSNIKGKIRQVPCHKNNLHRWLPKDALGDWIEETVPPRVGSILGVTEF